MSFFGHITWLQAHANKSSTTQPYECNVFMFTQYDAMGNSYQIKLLSHTFHLYKVSYVCDQKYLSLIYMLSKLIQEIDITRVKKKSKQQQQKSKKQNKTNKQTNKTKTHNLPANPFSSPVLDFWLNVTCPAVFLKIPPWPNSSIYRDFFLPLILSVLWSHLTFSHFQCFLSGPPRWGIVFAKIMVPSAEILITLWQITDNAFHQLLK